MSDPARPSATVIVVSWNAGDLLRLALDGLARQDLPREQFEVIVVDNASHDGTADMVEQTYPWVKVLRNKENLGFAGGNNTGLRATTTPYVALLNNDAIPEPSWLRRLLAPFDEPGGERLGAVTGKVLFLPRFARVRVTTEGFSPGAHDTRDLGVRVHSVEADGQDVTGDVLWERATFGREGGWTWTRPDGEWLVPVPAQGPTTMTVRWSAERAKPVTVSWEGGTARVEVGPEESAAEVVLDPPRVDVVNNVGGVFLENGYGADRGFQHVDDGRFDAPAAVMTACGNGMAMRTEAGREIGFFDEDFFLYYEDTDLSWRLRNRGWEVRYVPDAVLRHVHSASTGEESPVFRFHVDRNRLLLLTKLGPAALARREVLRYPLTTLSMTVRGTLGLVLRRPGRPPLRPLLLRWRVLRSFLRLLPRMLARRRAESRAAVVPRGAVEAHMTRVEDWLAGAA
jgi:GT2 family glycosyltransferase